MKLSLIIPVYNHYPELKNLLNSLREQTFKDFECIIVDDGSTPPFEMRLKNIASEFNFEIYFFKITHSGAATARNFGSSMARGDYLLFTDSDITFENNALQLFVQTLDENKNAAFAYSEYYFGFKKMKGIEFNHNILKKFNYIHTTSIVRKEYFTEFDVNLKKFQDWDLWLTLSSRGLKGKLISEVLFYIKPRRKYGTSRWLPSFAYKKPFHKLFSVFPAMREYNEARQILSKKHNLEQL